MRAGRTAAALVVLGAATAGLAAAWRRRAGGHARVPTRRSDRTAEVARLGVRTGVDFASMKVRSAVAGEERRRELVHEYELRTAEQVVESLGQMKGAMMKLGQMASYLDQGLPEHVREALSQLQADAPPMSSELASGVLEAELGAPPEELFAYWDPVPLASASIGQVHRATTHEGLDVAVKVQYPGIDEAISSDLQNTDLLFSMLGVLFAGIDPEPIVGELAERVAEELDYRVEASHQRDFASVYRGHPTIHVPEVVDGLSTSRVLTTELAHGARFSEMLEWPDAERQLAAETIYRFAFGSIYNLHAFNGDPHPGNYLFRPGGQVTFLDYGLCKRFGPEDMHVFESMIRTIVLDRDIPAFRSVLAEVGILPADAEVTDAEVDEYFSHFYEFVMEDGVSEITPEYASESVRRFFDLGGPHGSLMRQANVPPSMVIIQRINLGLYALFGEMRARNNWRRIAEELWPFVGAPPATEMGERIAEWEAARRAVPGP